MVSSWSIKAMHRLILATVDFWTSNEDPGEFEVSVQE